MKNIQVIDGAMNCTYPIYSVTEEEFLMLFPVPSQDIEFIEDVIKRIGEKAAGNLLGPVWKRPVSKPEVAGIHGTLFYELSYKKKYYPTKIDAEMIVVLGGKAE